MDALVRFGVAIPEGLLDEFDQFVRRKGLPSRSKALRQLIRERLSREMWAKGSGTVFGTVTIVYDHAASTATGALTALQHDHGESIICTTHVHVDHHHCMECIVLKGDAGNIRLFVDALGGVRGVQSIDLSITSIV